MLISHGRTFLDDPQAQAELADLYVRCLEVMSKRAAVCIDQALQQPPILTAAVASVLQRTPPTLEWEQLQDSCFGTGSFQAVSADGCLYSINTLDGTVLLDGRPPSRLPKAILGHRMYKRVFGAYNFEVRLGFKLFLLYSACCAVHDALS